MATTGALRALPAIEAWKAAWPKLNTLPSARTIQYPPKSAVAADPTTGALSGTPVARRLSVHEHRDLVARKLHRHVAATVNAAIGVAPRADAARPLVVQHHYEAIDRRVEIETLIVAPAGRSVARIEVETLKDAPELLARRIEQPGAVTGLKKQ